MDNVFKTPEEQETARLLGWKPPEGQKLSGPRPTKTRVVGYFNPNPWPIHIMISELGGMSVVLQQRGHYVLTSDGKKINDPVLEKHVGPNGLAKEMSPSDVPINFIPRPTPASSRNSSPVMEASAFVKGPNGQVMPVLKQAAAEVTAADAMPMNGVPVVGMTRAMAEQLRLIKPTRAIQESNVTDTDGAPVSGEAVPQIEYAEDMTPGEVRRLKASTPEVKAPQAAPSRAPVTRAPVRIAQPVQPVQEISPLHPELTAAESPEQAALVHSLAEAAKENPLGVTDVARLQPNLPAETPPPVEELAEVPIIYGGEPPTSPESPTTNRFVCAADGQGFQFRSGLDRYVKSRYPERYEELMRPYPKAQRVAPVQAPPTIPSA